MPHSQLPVASVPIYPENSYLSGTVLPELTATPPEDINPPSTELVEPPYDSDSEDTIDEGSVTEAELYNTDDTTDEQAVTEETTTLSNYLNDADTYGNEKTDAVDSDSNEVYDNSAALIDDTATYSQQYEGIDQYQNGVILISSPLAI
ncbi:unnamed protein product [Anisakis simplex]|uniref:Uncharacterized protein n=1 Tax=Anisakis simplex TaxID=6269 RepID=A0A3P6NIE3_ANISI|nr:unnamed protein product [Anisakis simplex]